MYGVVCCGLGCSLEFCCCCCFYFFFWGFWGVRIGVRGGVGVVGGWGVVVGFWGIFLGWVWVFGWRGWIVVVVFLGFWVVVGDLVEGEGFGVGGLVG